MNHYLTLILAFFTCNHACAQIKNINFECSNTNQTLCNWGSDIVLNVTIGGPNGQGDSIILFNNNYFAGANADAYSGSRALEISNAYNYTKNEVYAGRGSACNDTVFSAFQQQIPFNNKPTYISFYYKYPSIGGDTAKALFVLLDANSDTVGIAEKLFLNKTFEYQLINIPINYYNNNTPSTALLTFYSALDSKHYGTHFLIDDIHFDVPMMLIQNLNATLNIRPNPSCDKITLDLPQNALVDINDMQGKRVAYVLSGHQIDISNLKNGNYIIRVKTENKTIEKILNVREFTSM
jgi:hypothetical protein